ncbi:hypothetical protein GGX14DRAFT_392691 [Mycena pura]|uniref:Uncharacterized protein n=1 Tax=Mycena pura TaxID=153505 RepID=A0AAD6VIJ1_9AGAR|nr:hypothetical protein GGX14DRAFT_392691 [Mycena pura]
MTPGVGVCRARPQAASRRSKSKERNKGSSGSQLEERLKSATKAAPGWKTPIECGRGPARRETGEDVRRRSEQPDAEASSRTPQKRVGKVGGRAKKSRLATTMAVGTKRERDASYQLKRALLFNTANLTQHYRDWSPLHKQPGVLAVLILSCGTYRKDVQSREPRKKGYYLARVHLSQNVHVDESIVKLRKSTLAFEFEAGLRGGGGRVRDIEVYNLKSTNQLSLKTTSRRYAYRGHGVFTGASKMWVRLLKLEFERRRWLLSKLKASL